MVYHHFTNLDQQETNYQVFISGLQNMETGWPTKDQLGPANDQQGLQETRYHYKRPLAAYYYKNSYYTKQFWYIVGLLLDI